MQPLPSWERARGVPSSNGMSPNLSDPQERRTLRQLYPRLTDSQAKEADENLRQYVALALRVFERIELDPEAWARFDALTASRYGHRMNGEKPQTNSPNEK